MGDRYIAMLQSIAAMATPDHTAEGVDYFFLGDVVLKRYHDAERALDEYETLDLLEQLGIRAPRARVIPWAHKEEGGLALLVERLTGPTLADLDAAARKVYAPAVDKLLEAMWKNCVYKFTFSPRDLTCLEDGTVALNTIENVDIGLNYDERYQLQVENRIRRAAGLPEYKR